MRHSIVSRMLFAAMAPVMLAVVAGVACGGSGKVTGSDGSAASGGAIGSGGSTGSGGTRGASGGTGTGGGGPGESVLTLPGESVLMHHKNPSRDGVYVELTLTKAAISGFKQDTNFNPVLTNAGEIYAQPLFVDGGTGGTDIVIVATESNNIYALNAATGAQVWMANLGTPLPLAQAMCGNLDLYGVTGTPAIDFDSRTLFADAVVIPPGNAAIPTHMIFALSIDTGAVKAGWPIDVTVASKTTTTAFTPATTGQRGALTIANGFLYVPFSGLYGDCGIYNGGVLGVSISDPTMVQIWSTAYNGGGIWAPGGMASESTFVYAATGNTCMPGTYNCPQGRPGDSQGWGGGEGLVRFGTAGAFTGTPAYFAPTNWATLDGEDLDMAAGPVLFNLAGSSPGKLAIQFGKDGNAYLLDRTNLTGVGSAIGGKGTSYWSFHAASNEIISSPVVYTTLVATYVAFKGNGASCTSGTSGTLTTLKIVPGSPPSLAGSWCATAGSGSPMVTTSDGTNDAIVWVPGAENSNKLQAFDGDTGASITFTGSSLTIPNMRRYNAPIAAKGRIFVAADNALVAFTL